MASEGRGFNLERYKSLRRLDLRLNALDGAVKDLNLHQEQLDGEVDHIIDSANSTVANDCETSDTVTKSPPPNIKPARLSFMRRGSLLKLANGLGALEDEIDNIREEAKTGYQYTARDSFALSGNLDDLEDLQAELAKADREYETMLDPVAVDDASEMTEDSSYRFVQKMMFSKRNKSKSPPRRPQSPIVSMDTASDGSVLSWKDTLEDIDETGEHSHVNDDEGATSGNLRRRLSLVQDENLSLKGEVAVLQESQARLQSLQDETRRDIEKRAADLTKQFQESQKQQEGSLRRARQERSALEKRLSFRLQKLQSMESDHSVNMVDEETKRQEMEQELADVRSECENMKTQHSSAVEEYKREKEAIETQMNQLKRHHEAEKSKLCREAEFLERTISEQKEALTKLESQHQASLVENENRTIALEKQMVDFKQTNENELDKTLQKTKTLEKELSSRREAVDQLESQHKEDIQLLQELRKSLKEKSDVIAHWEEVADRLNKGKDKLSIALTQQEQLINASEAKYKEEREEKKTRIISLEKKIKELEEDQATKLQQFELNSQSYEEDLKNHREQIKVLEVLHDEAVAIKEQKIDSLTSELNRVQENSGAEKATSENEKRLMMLQLNEAQKKLDVARQKHDEEIKSLREAELTLNRGMEDKLANRDSEIMKTKDELKSLYKEVSSTKEAMKKLQIQHEGQLKSFEIERRDLLTELKELKALQERSSHEFESEKRQLFEKSAAQQEEIQDLKDQREKAIQRHEEQRNSLVKKLETKEEHVKEIQHILDATRQEHQKEVLALKEAEVSFKNVMLDRLANRDVEVAKAREQHKLLSDDLLLNQETLKKEQACHKYELRQHETEKKALQDRMLEIKANQAKSLQEMEGQKAQLEKKCAMLDNVMTEMRGRYEKTLRDNKASVTSLEKELEKKLIEIKKVEESYNSEKQLHKDEVHELKEAEQSLRKALEDKIAIQDREIAEAQKECKMIAGEASAKEEKVKVLHLQLEENAKKLELQKTDSLIKRRELEITHSFLSKDFERQKEHLRGEIAAQQEEMKRLTSRHAETMLEQESKKLSLENEIEAKTLQIGEFETLLAVTKREHKAEVIALIEAKESSTKGMKKEVKNRDHAIGKAQAECKRVSLEASSIKETLKQLQKMHKNHIERYEDDKRALSEKRQHLESTKVELEIQFAEEREKLLAECTTWKLENKRIEGLYKREREENVTQKSYLGKELENKSLQIHDMQKMLDTARKQHKEEAVRFKQEIESLKKENREKQINQDFEINNARDELKFFSQDLSSSMKEAMNQLKALHQAAQQKLETECRDLSTKLQERQELHTNAVKDFEKQKQELLKGSDEKIQQLRDLKKEHEKIIHNQELQKQSLESELERKVKHLGEVQQALDSTKQEHLVLKEAKASEKNTFENAVAYRDAQIKKAEDEMKLLSQQLVQKNAMMKKVKAEHMEVIKQVEEEKNTLSERLQDLQSKHTAAVKDFEHQNQRLVLKSTTQQQEMENLKEKFRKESQERQAQEASLEKELEGMRLETEKLQQTIESTRKDNQDEKARLETSKESLKKIMDDELQNRDGEIQKVTNELNLVSQELEEKKEAMKQLQAQHEGKLHQHEAEKKLLSDRLQELQGSQTATEKEFKTQKEELNRKYATLRTEIEEIQSAHEVTLREQEAKTLSLERELGDKVQQIKRVEESLEAAKQLHKDEVHALKEAKHSLKRTFDDKIAIRDSEIKKVQGECKGLSQELSSKTKSLDQLQVKHEKQFKQHEAEKGCLSSKVQELEDQKSELAKGYESQKKEFVNKSTAQQEAIREMEGLHKKEKDKLIVQQNILKKELERRSSYSTLEGDSTRSLEFQKKELDMSSMEDKSENPVRKMFIFIFLLAFFYFLSASRLQSKAVDKDAFFQRQAEKYQSEKMKLETKILETERAYFELKSNLSESLEESSKYKKHADMLDSELVQLKFEMDSLKRYQEGKRSALHSSRPRKLPKDRSVNSSVAEYGLSTRSGPVTPFQKGLAAAINQISKAKPVRQIRTQIKKLVRSGKDRTVAIAQHAKRKAGNIVKEERGRIRSEESVWLVLL